MFGHCPKLHWLDSRAEMDGQLHANGKPVSKLKESPGCLL